MYDCCTLETQGACTTVIGPRECGAGMTHAQSHAIAVEYGLI